MPNFMPKAFTRRKSSGNALEEFGAPTEPSFRVMPRREGSKPSNGDLTVKRDANPRPVSSPMQHDWQHSYDEDIRIGNRGSNGSSTANSGVSRFYDTGSSARHSSTSTLPSSAEFDGDELFFKKIPAPTDGGRTSSFTSLTGRLPFGNKKSNKGSGSPTHKHEPEETRFQKSSRDRAMTGSSYASTAQTTQTVLPPKLQDLPQTDFSSDFGDIFGNLGPRKSALQESPLPQPPPLALRSESEHKLPPPTKAFSSSRPTQPPSPIHVDRHKDVSGSPYSWDSRDSNDALMASPAAAMSPYNERPPPPVPRHTVHMTETPPPLQSRTNSTSPVSERKPARNGTSKSASLPVEDEDARLVRESFRASREVKGPQAAQVAQAVRQNGEPHSSDASIKTTSFSSTGSSVQSHRQEQTVSISISASPNSPSEATPRAKGAVAHGDEEEPLFSKTLPPSARPGVRFEQKKPQARMTQAEFAMLQRQHQRDPISDDESDESDEYVDDDLEEEERRKIEEMRMIRQQQQEKMSAHREMMKKTTGGMNGSFGGSQRPVSMDHPGINRNSASMSELLGNRASYFGGNDYEEDDTDDIPLGILKEHKFPKLGNRLSHHSSLTNLRASSAQGLRAPSAAGSVVGGSMNLPPFARGLPADVPSEPYLGANLVNQPMRESLGYGAMGPASAYGGSSGGGAQPTLVNMIADAEQAKEARRGGATKIFGNNNYGQRLPQNPLQSQMPTMNQGMGMMGMGMGQQQMMMPPPQMGMHQMQLQQMQQMAQLQQQMQMMLQQQHMGMQMGMPQQMMPSPVMQQPNFLSPTTAQRPMSMASNHGIGQQRTRSMINTSSFSLGNLGQQFGSNLQPGYSPSLAPSERSNVGTSARYRPVSQQFHDGSSTVMSASTVQPPQAGNQRLTVRVKPKPTKTQTDGAHDDDDDEEGWGAAPKKNKWAAAKKPQENQLAEFIPAFE